MGDSPFIAVLPTAASFKLPDNPNPGYELVIENEFSHGELEIKFRGEPVVRLFPQEGAVIRYCERGAMCWLEWRFSEEEAHILWASIKTH